MNVKIYTPSIFGRLLIAESVRNGDKKVMYLNPCFRLTSDCEVEVDEELEGDLHFCIGTPNGMCSYAVLTENHPMSPQTFRVCENIVPPSVPIMLELKVIPFEYRPMRRR